MPATALIVAAVAPVAGLAHPLNWFAGWTFILLAFLSGAVIGVNFHSESYLGGYASLRRRLVRLGHISFAALGIINLMFALSPWPRAGGGVAFVASLAWIAGAALMPAVCFLAAWQDRWRGLFFMPVLSLVTAAALTLLGGFL